MGKFGDKLKREREMRGVTLDEIAEATKIGTRSLRALEEERFDQLPGGIFNKGFVRSYARFLGLDEEQAVSDYLAAQAEQPSKGDVLEKMAAQTEAARINEAAALGGESGRANRLWITLAVVVLVGIGGAGGWKYYHNYYQQKLLQRQAEVPFPQVKTAPPGPVNLTPVDTSGSPNTVAAAAPSPEVGQNTPKVSTAVPTATTTTSAPVKTPDTKPVDGTKKPIELQIHVARATWLSVQADGREATTETLRDSATKTVVAQDRVVLTTGNAVEVTCNGASLGTVGADNKRSQVRITSDCKVN